MVPYILLEESILGRSSVDTDFIQYRYRLAVMPLPCVGQILLPFVFWDTTRHVRELGLALGQHTRGAHTRKYNEFASAETYLYFLGVHFTM